MILFKKERNRQGASPNLICKTRLEEKTDLVLLQNNEMKRKFAVSTVNEKRQQ